MPEIRAVGCLGHNWHVHFREGLRIHARLNEGDGLGQPFPEMDMPSVAEAAYGPDFGHRKEMD